MEHHFGRGGGCGRDGFLHRSSPQYKQEASRWLRGDRSAEELRSTLEDGDPRACDQAKINRAWCEQEAKIGCRIQWQHRMEEKREIVWAAGRGGRCRNRSPAAPRPRSEPGELPRSLLLQDSQLVSPRRIPSVVVEVVVLDSLSCPVSAEDSPSPSRWRGTPDRGPVGFGKGPPRHQQANSSTGAVVEPSGGEPMPMAARLIESDESGAVPSTSACREIDRVLGNLGGGLTAVRLRWQLAVAGLYFACG